MSSTEQSQSRVTLLQFLRVVPSSAWLRASILWADNLAAIWPMHGPTPRSPAQEKSLQEVRSLLDVGLFERKYLHGFLTPATVSNAARALNNAVSSKADAPLYEGWNDDGPAAGSAPVPVWLKKMLFAEQDDLDQNDFNRFLYPGKLPTEVIRELTRQGVIMPGRGRYGYTLRSADFLDQLLAGYARLLHARSGGRLLPDVEESGQARRIAAPVDAETSCRALVLTLRGAVKPDLETDFQRFIDFRANAKNERARQDYLEQLTRLWDDFARGGPDNASEQMLGQVAADLDLARQSYLKRVAAQTLAGQVLTSISVIIPLAVAHPLPAVVGALSALGGSAVTVTVRNDAPIYIRRATKSELLAPTVL